MNFCSLLPLADVRSKPTDAQLVIIEQQSLAKESFTNDGEKKVVHNVVKNTPFIIRAALTSSTMYGGSILDFSRLTLDASLLYDSWEEEKAVPYLKDKPIQYHGKVNDKGDTMTLSTKIKVLSSHCENMLFRVKLQGLDSRTSEPIPSLMAISEPIKVISKPDQILKTKDQPMMDAKARGKKRTINDRIIESLERLEEQQRESQKLLQKMFEEGSVNHPAAKMTVETTLTTLATTTTMQQQYEMEKEVKDCGEGKDGLEKAYHAFVDAYKKLAPEERPEKIRRIVKTSTVRETETFTEMVAMFNSEGLDAKDNFLALAAGCLYFGQTDQDSEIFYKGFLNSPHDDFFNAIS